MILKVILAVLLPLGIFARFFFGISTFNQIFIGFFLGLAVTGLFFFEDFWNKHFKAMFNSNSSSCGARWLTLLIGFGAILDYVGIYLVGRYQITKVEGGALHAYARSTCKSECFHTADGRNYLSNQSFVDAAWWAWMPMILIYFGITSSVKYSNNKLNLIKYAAQIKSPKKILVKLAIYLVVCSVLVISAFVTLKVWWWDALFKFGMSLLWVILYRWVFPTIKKKMDTFIGSDMFAPWMNDDDDEKKSLI